MTRSISSLAATFALIGASNAAIIFDKFESYTALSDMNGEGGWTVSNGNPASPGDGPVVIADTYTWDSPLSAGSATVGGYAQTTLGVTSLYHSAAVPFISPIGYGAEISFEFDLTESTSGPDNPFSFVVTSSAGNLLTIDLTPVAGVYNYAWSSAFATGSTFGTLAGGNPTGFTFVLSDQGVAGIGFELKNAGSFVAGGILSGASATDTITEFSANWNSAGGAGNNSITLDNVSVVPEPSASLLGLLGASCLFLRRRRA